MKKRVLTPVFASLVMIGAFMMTSCSNNDERIVEQEQAQSTVELRQQLDNAVATLNQQMSGLNFEELSPLTVAIWDNEGNETDGLRQKFNTWLAELLQRLNQDFSKSLPYGFVRSFESVEGVLSTVWSISGQYSFGRQDGKDWMRSDWANVITSDYTARDSSLYQVTLEEIKERDYADSSWGRSKERRLTIKKNGVHLLTIRACKENETMFMGLLPSKSIDYTGEITYQDYIVSLGYGREKAHERTIELNVDYMEGNLVNATTNLTDNLTLPNLLKNDVTYAADYNLKLLNGLILADGKVNNIGKLIANSIVLLGLRKQGATQGLCDEYATMFNDNMTLNLTASDSDLGYIKMAPVFSEKKNKYVPTLLLYSPLFGEEPVDITTMLNNFGISIDDILGSLGGDDEE